MACSRAYLGGCTLSAGGELRRCEYSVLPNADSILLNVVTRGDEPATIVRSHKERVRKEIFDVARKKTLARWTEPTYDAVLADVVGLVDAARHAAVRSTNAVMTATYWAIGRRIVEHGQHGAERAGYGEALIVRLSGDLQSRFGRGFGRANLFQMRSFYLAYRHILQTAPGESAPPFRKVQTLSGPSAD